MRWNRSAVRFSIAWIFVVSALWLSGQDWSAARAYGENAPAYLQCRWHETFSHNRFLWQSKRTCRPALYGLPTEQREMCFWKHPHVCNGTITLDESIGQEACIENGVRRW